MILALIRKRNNLQYVPVVHQNIAPMSIPTLLH